MPREDTYLATVILKEVDEHQKTRLSEFALKKLVDKSAPSSFEEFTFTLMALLEKGYLHHRRESISTDQDILITTAGQEALKSPEKLVEIQSVVSNIKEGIRERLKRDEVIVSAHTLVQSGFVENGKLTPEGERAIAMVGLLRNQGHAVEGAKEAFAAAGMPMSGTWAGKEKKAAALSYRDESRNWNI